jgi:surfactin synthase thioesterase subunit
MAEDYVDHATIRPVNASILAIGSKQDPWLTDDAISQWSRFTKAEFEEAIFEGDHFYLNQQTKALTERIKQTFLALDVGPAIQQSLNTLT